MTDPKSMIRYQSALAQARAMLKKGIINREDYVAAEGLFAVKYCINSGSIIREKDLINMTFRANMSHDEGGGENAEGH